MNKTVEYISLTGGVDCRIKLNFIHEYFISPTKHVFFQHLIYQRSYKSISICLGNLSGFQTPRFPMSIYFALSYIVYIFFIYRYFVVVVSHLVSSTCVNSVKLHTGGITNSQYTRRRGNREWRWDKSIRDGLVWSWCWWFWCIVLRDTCAKLLGKTNVFITKKSEIATKI